MARLGFLLVLYVSLIFCVTVHANMVESHRRSHGSLGRLIKKRSSGGGGLGNVLADVQSTSQVASPTVAGAAQTSDSAAAAPTTSAAAAAATSASPTSASPASASSSSGGLLGSVVGGILSTTATSASSSPSSSIAITTHTTSGTPTTQAAVGSVTTSPAEQQQQQQSPSVYYVTSSSSSTPTSSSAPESASTLSHTAVTVLIVIAVSIGAAVILWTVIRKWKFRPSSNFEDRMQPIDWRPDGGEGSDIPGTRRPISNASSFQSGSHSADDHSQTHSAGHSAGVLPSIPDHDFTPGPAHFAPVGGYADLARGPTLSAEPVMQEALGRAPSINHQYQYDQYGVPLHHGYNAPSY
ncbi:hypothetical protein EV401DRAFT_2071141 [Pisolithus croceorrhizus]|nr:hypothetical protein EV401DRAFT_2071141 [Pisolithus croceorrhizus]